MENMHSIPARAAQPIIDQNTSAFHDFVKPEEPFLHPVFESKTGTWQYVVADPHTLHAVIIDPVLDYDPATQKISTYSADALLDLVKENRYIVDMLLETHAHADHMTAASYLQGRLTEPGGTKPAIGIGRRILQVQKFFGESYAISEEAYAGSFDRLFDDNETFSLGDMDVKVIHLPGHTPDHVGYKIGGEYPDSTRLLSWQTLS